MSDTWVLTLVESLRNLGNSVDSLSDLGISLALLFHNSDFSIYKFGQFRLLMILDRKFDKKLRVTAFSSYLLISSTFVSVLEVYLSSF